MKSRISNLSNNGTILLSGKSVQWQRLARIDTCKWTTLLTITWHCSMLAGREFTCTVYRLADHSGSEYSLFTDKS